MEIGEELTVMFREQDKYDLGIRLGKGTYGEVYSMVEKGGNNPLPYVVKICDLQEDGTCGFAVLREIVPLAILGPKYPKLFPRIVATNKFDSRMYIIMDRYDCDLLAHIEKGSLFRDLSTIISLTSCLAIQGLRSLRVLHHCGIAHRDVKTSNFLIRRSSPPALHIYQRSKNQTSNASTLESTLDERLGISDLVLADFSLAKKLRVVNSREVMTPGYCAPETPEGMQGTTTSYNCKVDIYSLGCTLYEVLTGGKFLPEGPDPIQRLEKYLRQNYKTINTMMKNLIGLIDDMLHPDPIERPSADSLLTSYTRLLFRSGFNGMNDELKVRHKLPIASLEIHSKSLQFLEIAQQFLKGVDFDMKNETLSLLKYFVSRYNEKTGTNFFDEELRDTEPTLWVAVCYFLVWSYYVGDGRGCKAISLQVASSNREKKYQGPHRENKKYHHFAVAEKLFNYETFIKAYWIVIRMTSFRILFQTPRN